MVTLFSTGCPRCNVLKKKLDAAGIDYVETNEVEEIVEKGFMTVPVLKTEAGEYLDFSAAVKWIK